MDIVKMLNEHRVFVNGRYPYESNITLNKSDITPDILSAIDKWCAQNDDCIVFVDILGMDEDIWMCMGEVYASPENHWCEYKAGTRTNYIDVWELLNSLGCY